MPLALLLRLALFSLLATACLARAEVRLVVDDVAPFAYRDGAQIRGVSYELLRELAARCGHSGAIELMPLARELALVQGGPLTLGTLGRLKERETSYTWIAPLFDEEVLLVARASSVADIGSVAAARSLRVGVIRGGPASLLARELGFLYVDAASNAESNARKLALGRIDVWLAAWGVAAHAQRQIGAQASDLRRGAVLQRFSMFLAGPPHMPAAEVEKWRAALESMKRDGSYARIVRAYNYD